METMKTGNICDGREIFRRLRFLMMSTQKRKNSGTLFAYFAVLESPNPYHDTSTVWQSLWPVSRARDLLTAAVMAGPPCQLAISGKGQGRWEMPEKLAHRAMGKL